MEKDRVWADAIVLQVAAWYLHHDIHVVMASATEKKPLCTFSGSWVREGAPCDKTPLLLGYLNDLHYQSLLPEADDLFKNTILRPSPNLPSQIPDLVLFFFVFPRPT